MMQTPAQARPEWSQAAAVRMVEDGWTDRQIAAHFGIDLKSLSKRIDYAVAHYVPPAKVQRGPCLKCRSMFKGHRAQFRCDPCLVWAREYGGGM